MAPCSAFPTVIVVSCGWPQTSHWRPEPEKHSYAIVYNEPYEITSTASNIDWNPRTAYELSGGNLHPGQANDGWRNILRNIPFKSILKSQPFVCIVRLLKWRTEFRMSPRWKSRRWKAKT